MQQDQGDMQQDRRSIHRVVVVLPVKLEREDGTIVEAHTVNLSRTGVQVSCTVEQAKRLMGDEEGVTQFPELKLELPLGERSPLRTMCKVLYCHRQSQQEYCLGLKYLAVDDSGLETVEGIISAA